LYNRDGDNMNKLIKWYQENKRDLPWRRSFNPYHTWISEIMLQQTQVQTVIPYFLRFIEAFPAIDDLANANEEEVLKKWEGLGYYSRARNLHKCAKEIDVKHQGVLPNEYKSLLKLPGIGPYTAGAILSIAFNQKQPAVDGNVFRVFSRLFMIDDDIALPKTRKVFESKVLDEMKDFSPSEFNQALMDFGATICTPKQPKCIECPLKDQCLAFESGYELDYPVKVKKTKQTIVPMIVAIIRDGDNHFFMRKRPDKGLLAGLYEFVTFQGHFEDDLINYLNLHYDMTIKSVKALGEVNHVFTHRKWIMSVYEVEVSGVTQRMYTPNQMLELPISTAHKKVLKLIEM